MVAFSGSQATNELHQWCHMCMLNTLVDVHSHLVHTVHKLKVQTIEQFLLSNLVLGGGGKRDLISEFTLQDWFF